MPMHQSTSGSDLDSSLANFDLDAVAACEPVWSKINSVGTLPRGRSSHTATALDSSRFVVVGGVIYGARGSWTYLNDAHVFDTGRWSWTELIVARDEEAGLPAPRSGHVAALWRDNVVLLFGGSDGKGDLNDCWCLHVSTPRGRWYKLKPTGTIPPARAGASGCFSAEHFIVLGGYNMDSKVYALDPFVATWSVVTTTGRYIPAFSNAGYCANRSALYIFGGNPSAGFLQLRIKARTSLSAQLGADGTSARLAIEVTSCLLEGEVPSLRTRLGMYLLSDRWLIVFGGLENSSDLVLNDCYLLDLRRRSDNSHVAHGRRVQPRGESEPQPRYGSTIVSFGTKFVIFGGRDRENRIDYNESWLLDLCVQPSLAISETSVRDSASDLARPLESDAGAALAAVSTQAPALGQISIRIADVALESGLTSNPIVGVGDTPRTSLAQAVTCAGVPNMATFVYRATERGEALAPTVRLAKDEAAGLVLYTMESGFYAKLNSVLRELDRAALKPFFPYLRLMLDARRKLPAFVGTVWRGVKGLDLLQKFPKDEKVFWWAFSSASKELEVLQNPGFLGQSGIRTIFCIQTTSGVDITAFSEYQEAEVLLYPGTKYQVVSSMAMGGGLAMVHLDELPVPVELFS